MFVLDPATSPSLFIYIYVLLSYFGPGVLQPLPTFPSHNKSDLRKEQHSGLRLISQHLLGPMCDPTEGGMAVKLDSGIQRLPWEGCEVAEGLCNKHQSREQTESSSMGHLALKSVSLFMRCTVLALGRWGRKCCLSPSQFRVETDLQFLHPISSCGACTVTHKTPLISARPYYLETWVPCFAKVCFYNHTHQERVPGIFGHHAAHFLECLPATSRCLSAFFPSFFVALLLSHWFLSAFVPFPESGPWQDCSGQWSGYPGGAASFRVLTIG